MKLSEAIRLGAMLKPQARGVLFGTRRKSGWRGLLLRETEHTSCAIGAAIEAGKLGTKPYIAPSDYDGWRGTKVKAGTTIQVLDLPDEMRNVFERLVPCPMSACGHGFYRPMATVITHLNDEHGWTREQIADWVESIEREEEQAQKRATADPVTVEV